MSTNHSDVIDRLAGIQPGSTLDALRDQRPQARDNAQKSYLALFEPEVPGDVTALERYAVATFVAGLHRQPQVAGFYAAGLRTHGSPEIVAAIEAGLDVASGLHVKLGAVPAIAEAAARRATVRAALQQLEPRERELIALKFHAGLSNAEIARVMSVTEQSVKKYTSRIFAATGCANRAALAARVLREDRGE